VATISSPGLGTNLDVKTIVSQLMSVERQPLAQLEKREASHQAKLSAFGSLKSALSTLQSAAQTINLSSTFSSVKASVADSTSLNATTSGSAVAGTYDIEVKSLAQSQKLVSGGYADRTTVVGSGTIKINFGAYSDAVSPPVTFAPKTGNVEKSISIDSANNTLEGIRDAINNSGAGVTATIINDGSTYRLALTSNESGAQNAMKITVQESGSAGLANLAYDASAGGVSNLTQNVAARDSVIKVDGVTITKPSNTITDGIQGVTLNLTKEMAANTTTRLTLTRDTSSIKTAVDAFVKAYNSVNKQISESTAYNVATGKGSILTGDATMRSIQAQLRSTLSTALPGAPGGLSTLSEVGIGFQQDGTLALDAAKLDKVLADPSKDISRLFVTVSGTNGSIGFGSRMNSLVSGFIFGKDAVLNGRIDGINTSIKDIGKQRVAQNERLATVEKRYIAQFTALDVAISGMTKTSTFLTQQLNAINANSKQ
jgi:flagellar hook-associated protein 2